mgnify:CR=1 FL=1
MRKNKGFTLIELLAIIVILGLIALAAIPNISKQVKESEKQEQTVLDKKIENASKLYAAKYYADKIVKCDSSSCDIKFTLNNLENDGLLSLNDDQCSGGTRNNEIEVNKDGDKIIFNYSNIGNGTDCHSCKASECIK